MILRQKIIALTAIFLIGSLILFSNKSFAEEENLTNVSSEIQALKKDIKTLGKFKILWSKFDANNNCGWW